MPRLSSGKLPGPSSSPPPVVSTVTARTKCSLLVPPWALGLKSPLTGQPSTQSLTADATAF